MTLTRMAALAWLNLIHDPRRLAVSMAGVAFAVVLMSMELGFRFALLDSMVEIVRLLDTDLVIVSKSKNTLASNAPFNRRILQEVLSFDGVEEACPLYIETRFSSLRNAEPGRSLGLRNARGGGTQRATARRIRVLAFDPRSALLSSRARRERGGARRALKPRSTTRSRTTRWGGSRAGDETRMARRPLQIVGTFRLGNRPGERG